jgi:hypothetical protein
VIDPSTGLLYEQLPAWPDPRRLCLPEQLMLPIAVPEHRLMDTNAPAGVEPVEPPDAPAAIACVDEVLAEVRKELGVSELRVRWYHPSPVPDGEKSYLFVLGFIQPGSRAIWLNVGYASPHDLARTVAHEVVHQWQDIRRGPDLDALEFDEREGEAQRRAEVLVPKGRFRTPRGKKRDAWFEPARRRTRAKNVAEPVAHPPAIAADAVASVLR